MRPRWIDRPLRVVGTGLGFVGFGLGCVVLNLLIFPGVRILSRGARRQRWTRASISASCRLFVWWVTTLGLIRCDYRGLDDLESGVILAANHPTLIDIVLLLARLPQAGCVVKPALLENWFTRGPISAAGYVPGLPGEPTLNVCANLLSTGETLIVFPEGTRTGRDSGPVLGRGAARIALAAGCPVVPVAIDVQPTMLKRGEPWYRIPPRPSTFSLERLETVIPSKDHSGSLEARKVTRLIQERIDLALQARSAAQQGGAFVH